MLLNMVSNPHHDADTSSHPTPEITSSLTRIRGVTWRLHILSQFSHLPLNELHLYGVDTGIAISQ
jgi:hypothetical protein